MNILNILPQAIVPITILLLGMILSTKLSLVAYCLVGMLLFGNIVALMIMIYTYDCFGHNKICAKLKKLI